MNQTALIALAVAAGVLALLIVLRIVLAVVRRRMARVVEERFDRHDIVGATTAATFLGERSRGGRQVRGNGALVLTREALHFIRAFPEREYVVPVSAITEISLPRSFNGKPVLARLLCVHYAIDGRRDAMAWASKKPEAWRDAIDDLRRR